MPFLSTLLDVVFPRCCILCNSASDQPKDLCKTCQSLLPIILSHCHRCALPLPMDQTTCGQCQKKPPVFDSAWALYAYTSPITSLIKRYKFNRKYAYSAVFSNLMITGIEAALKKSQIQQPDLIIPMPLHWTRTMKRGFNQSMELSKTIAKYFGIQHSNKIATRCKRTHYQSNLSPTARQRNLKGAFTSANTSSYRHIAIIDDILTTGASANALATVLKQQGASKISLWTLARTVAESAT